MGTLANKDLVKLKKELVKKNKRLPKTEITEQQRKDLKVFNEETFLYFNFCQEGFFDGRK